MQAPTILEPGTNCWRVAHARRVTPLVDAAAYFEAARTAILRARRSILIAGWDLDAKIPLVHGDPADGAPATLGELLQWAVCRRGGPVAHVLVWDFAMIYAMERAVLPLYTLQWRSRRRLHLHMDDAHPVGASHHQKIVVVDDAVAFCGGLDLTGRRWDTPEHLPGDRRRRDAGGEPYGPFHDVQVMLDGEAARCLAELVRERWRRATGRRIAPCEPPAADPWPPGIEPEFEGVDVAIARTEPAYDGRAPVREVCRLYRDAIAAARYSLYFESQYLTSAVVSEALAARLHEDGGPEIVLVLPRESPGWLEQTTMDVIRARVLRRLRAADRHGRLRVYHPVAAGGTQTPITVHAKLMIADDRLLRVGSSNLSNRSMGLDTECDLAIEAAGDGRLAAGIAAFGDRLLAEHLGCRPRQVAEARREHGGLIGAIQALGDGDRTLLPLDGEVSPALDQTVPESALVDPEMPLDPETLSARLVPDDEREGASRAPLGAIALVLGLLALAAAWRWTPLGDWVDLRAMGAWVSAIADSPAGALVGIGAFVAGSLVAFPVTVLVVASSLAFGPLLGFVYALAGTTAGAALTFGIGHTMNRDLVRRLGGRRINRLSRWLARRGILSTAIIRMLPVAPFTIVNIVAGASHIRFRDFMIGSVLGITPGMLALTVFADGVSRAARDPSLTNLGWVAVVAIAIAAGALVLRNWVRRRAPDRAEE